MLKNQADKLILEKKLYQLIISRLDGYDIRSRRQGKDMNLWKGGLAGS
jgi:hypothetical protein